MSDVRKLTWSINAKGDISHIEKANSGMDSFKTKAASMDKQLIKNGKSLQDFGSKANNIGGKMNKYVSIPLLAAGTAGTKMALDLDNSIRKVTTLADQNILPVSKIKSEVRAISDASGKAQTEISGAIYDSLSAGVESANVMEFVRSGIDLTRAGFTDMDTVIDATTTVLNAYGDKAFSVSKIHDIFVQTQDKGKISVDELGKSIGRVVPTASTLGVNMDQLGASYAILTAKGQNAQLSTTNLNAMLGELGKTGSLTDEALKKATGQSFKQLIEGGKNIGEVLGIVDEQAKKNKLSLADMFGSTSAAAAANTLLSEGVEGFNKSLDDMHNATGKTAENAATMEDGWFKIEKATTQVKNTLIDAGAEIAPFVEKAAIKVSELVEKFTGLDDGTKGTIMKMAAIATVGGPAISTFGKLSIGVGKFIGHLGNTGVVSKFAGGIAKIATTLGGPVTIGIGAAIVGGVALYKNWDTIKEKAGEMSSVVKEKWTEVSTKLEDKVNAKIDVAMDAYNTKVAEISSKWNQTKATVKEKVVGKVDAINDSFNTKIDSVKTKWSNTKADIKAGIKGKVDAATSSFQTRMDAVKSKWESVKTFLQNPIQGTVSLVQKGASWVKGKVAGSHATGINNIPYDNYLGNLHKGEMVLTKKTSDEYRARGGTKDRVPELAKTDNGYNIINNNINTQGNASESDEPLVYSPTINMHIHGSNQTNKELQKIIEEAIRADREKFFKKVKIQRG